MLPWSPDADDRPRIDALRLMRQIPAVTSLTLIDGGGRERVHISRVGLDRIESGADASADPAFRGAMKERLWFGPVTFHRDSEPFITVAMRGNRSAAGVVVAEVNFKLVWDVVSSIHVGETGRAIVQAASAAHPLTLIQLRCLAARRENLPAPRRECSPATWLAMTLL